MFFESTLCCLTPLCFLFFFWLVGWLVFFFNFYFFLPSQTWMLGFSLGRLQKILCLVFLFVRCVPFFNFFFPCCFFFFFFFPFVCIYFTQKLWVFFFSSNLPFWNLPAGDSLEPCFPLLGCCFSFPFLVYCFEVTAFRSRFSFTKGEPAQFRFHSSEFSVSIMHSYSVVVKIWVNQQRGLFAAAHVSNT